MMGRHQAYVSTEEATTPRISPLSLTGGPSQATTVSSVFGHILGLQKKDTIFLRNFDSRGDGAYVEEFELNSGNILYSAGSGTDGFYVVLSGTVAVFLPGKKGPIDSGQILSGAGTVNPGALTKKKTAKSAMSGDVGEIGVFLQVGSIFGFVDYVLERQRTFGIAAARDRTIVAKLSRDSIERLRRERPAVERIIDKVLLQASVLEISNMPF